MTDTDRALERLRAANPLPDSSHVDADELGAFVSLFEERSDAMSGIKTIHRDEKAQRPQRRFRPLSVFVTSLVAVLLVVGAAALLLRGDENPVDPTTPIADSPQATAPVDQTTPITEPAPLPAPAPEMTATVLSDQLEYNSVVAMGPDGLPIVASVALEGPDESGTIRLFYCLDEGCETQETVELKSDVYWLARDLEMAVAPNGDIYLLAGETVLLYSNGELVELAPMFRWRSEDVPALPSAFMQDGRPVFTGMIDEAFSAVVCDDAACTSYLEIPIEDASFIRFFDAFAVDGSIVVSYATGEPVGPPDPDVGYDGADLMVTTRIATITGIDDEPAVGIETVNEGLNEIPFEAAISDDGSVVMWSHFWEQSETPGEPVAREGNYTLTCSGSDCVKVEASALGYGARPYQVTPDVRLITAQTEVVYDPVEYQDYLDEERRISEAGLDQGAEEPEPLGTNLVVVECVDTECTTVRRSVIEARPGWWYLDALKVTVSEDGTTYVLVGSDIVLDDPGMVLYVFPPGTLADQMDPFVGTAVAQ